MEMLCPYCGTRNTECHSSTGDPLKLPCPGGIALCWSCRKLSMITGVSEFGLQTRKLSDKEREVIVRRPETIAMLEASRKALGPLGAVRLAALDYRTYGDGVDDPMSLPPKDYGSDRYDYIQIDAPEDVPLPEWLTPEWMPCQDCRANAFLTWTGNAWTTMTAHDEGCPTLLHWEAQQ